MSSRHHKQSGHSQLRRSRHITNQDSGTRDNHEYRSSARYERSDRYRSSDREDHRDDMKGKRNEELESSFRYDSRLSRAKRGREEKKDTDKFVKKRKIDYASVLVSGDKGNLSCLSAVVGSRKGRIESLEMEMMMLENKEGMTKRLQWDEKSLSDMSKKDWRIFKEDMEIVTKGGSIPNALRNDWEEADLPDWMMRNIRECGYKTPTAIQMQAIPIGLSKRDMMGIAETGSGKTAAFVIPMLVQVEQILELNKSTETNQPLAIIVAPTRELILQIENSVNDLSNRARTISLIGGVSKLDQGMDVFNFGCDIVLATPGRLLDCLESGYFGLDKCIYYILDEADRMTEEFEEDIIKILEISPRKGRSMMMFSATMPPSVEKLAATYLNNPAYIYVGELGLAVKNIIQNVEFVPSYEKDNEDNFKQKRLSKLLKNGPRPPVIVFVNRKERCEKLVKYITSIGYSCIGLNSKKSQQGRIEALDDFKDRKYQVLVATDIASRGVHIEGVQHVINYDMPKTIVTYTHRIGRTGRMGLKGLATSFLTNEDTEIMPDLKEVLSKTGNICPDELKNHPCIKGMKNLY